MRATISYLARLWECPRQNTSSVDSQKAAIIRVSRIIDANDVKRGGS